MSPQLANTKLETLDELEELRRDKARLDFLSDHVRFLNHGPRKTFTFDCDPSYKAPKIYRDAVRKTIDEALRNCQRKTS